MLFRSYCVKHIYNNFKVNHKGMELKSVLWRCAGTTSAREFERGMDHLKSLDEQAWKYLTDIEPAQWTRSYFSPRALTDCMVNNLSESFNSMIVKARDKPILSMLEWIRVRLNYSMTPTNKYTISQLNDRCLELLFCYMSYYYMSLFMCAGCMCCLFLAN